MHVDLNYVLLLQHMWSLQHVIWPTAFAKLLSFSTDLQAMSALHQLHAYSTHDFASFHALNRQDIKQHQFINTFAIMPSADKWA